MKTRLLSSLSLDTDFGILLLRWVFGGLMFYHGYTKVASFNEFLNKFPDIIGIGSQLSFVLLVFAEFGCSLLVILGLLTRLASVPIFIAMAVAVLVAHAKDTFQVKELALVFMLLSVVTFVLGSGKYSIDRMILKD